MTNTLVRENNGRATDRRESEKFVAPPASVSETADGYTLELEIPGVNKEGLEISIVGRRSHPAVDGTLVHRKSRPHNCRRSFEIDPSIGSGKIIARMNQGVVTVTLPKAEAVNPRKITVS